MCWSGLLPLITYADTSPGQAMWRYDNTLISRDFGMNQGGATNVAQIDVGEPEEEEQSGKQGPAPTRQQWGLRVLTQPSTPSPLPLNASSEYLETLSTGFSFYTDSIPIKARCHITLRAKTGLPAGAYLEAQFQDPARPETFFAVGQTYLKKTLKEAREPLLFISPDLVGTKCGNHEVVVSIYADTSKATLLGTHRQLVQTNVDTDRVKSIEEFVEVMSGKRNACGETIYQGENLNFPIPSGWRLMHRSMQGNVHLEEYLPFGQTVYNWQEMITVMAIHGQQIDPGTYLADRQDWNWRNCQRASKEYVARGQEEGVSVATTVLVCGHVPATDKAEVAVIKALAGKDNFYAIHRQWRLPAGDPSQISQSLRKDINAAFEFLSDARMCDTRDPAHQCQIPSLD